MPFSATVFNVLIASPSDVPRERAAIADSLHEWNALHSEVTGKVLLPVMWESHSAPAMGDRPQGIINDQVVRSCDLLIGAFRSRLGSPTGEEESGTVEEIRWFLKNRKPVMLYYAKQVGDVDELDLTQLEKLQKFKESIRDKGIQENYNSVEELRQKLTRQLTIVMRGTTVDTVVNAKVFKEAKASGSEADGTRTRAAETREDTDEIFLEEYSDRAFAVRGETYDLREDLKGLGGRYIPLPKTGGGKGWIFPKARLAEVAQLLDLEPELRRWPAT